MASLDVIVVGLGAMGSATCYYLARAGARVLGVEQFSRGHALGSSHGHSRLIRRSYLSAPSYVPWLTRSYQLWRSLEVEAGRALFHRTGLLVASQGVSGAVPERAAEVATSLGISIEGVAAGRFPGLALPPSSAAYFEPDAGYLEADAAVETFTRLAEQHGAALRFDEPVTRLRWNAEGVDVITPTATHRAAAVVVTAGPWSAGLLREVGVSLAVRRVPQLWFPVGATCFASNGMPCFSVHLPYGHFYGVPSVDGKTMKVCGGGERETVVDPSRLDRELHARDLLPIRRFIGDWLPGVLSSDPSAFDMCMCTMTPDESFIVDRHPLSNRVVFAAGFSGHGFKLAPSMGELLASLATQPDASSPAFLALRETVTQNGVGRALPQPRTTTSSATIR